MKNKVIVVVGPTAVGKTKIAIELAKYLNVSVRTISYYNTPTYKRRVKTGYKVYIIEDDD